MSRYRVRLEMARNADYPEGDSQCGYEFDAPLLPNGHIDPIEWEKKPQDYPVTRFWSKEAPRIGRLIYTATHSWHFHYSNVGEPDEPTFLFDQEKFIKDGFVSLRDHAGEMRIFHIVSVDPIEENQHICPA